LRPGIALLPHDDKVFVGLVSSREAMAISNIIMVAEAASKSLRLSFSVWLFFLLMRGSALFWLALLGVFLKPVPLPFDDIFIPLW
jgi:hypothetical protein